MPDSENKLCNEKGTEKRIERWRGNRKEVNEAGMEKKRMREGGRGNCGVTPTASIPGRYDKMNFTGKARSRPGPFYSPRPSSSQPFLSFLTRLGYAKDMGAIICILLMIVCTR